MRLRDRLSEIAWAIDDAVMWLARAAGYAFGIAFICGSIYVFISLIT
jgi:hypothetical protein